MAAQKIVLEQSYTAAQLAELWQVHERTVCRRCVAGQLPGAWLDSAGWRIPASAAAEYQRRRQIVEARP
jgi:NMD protein affecting ribosome stability and mRNA decay